MPKKIPSSLRFHPPQISCHVQIDRVESSNSRHRPYRQFSYVSPPAVVVSCSVERAEIDARTKKNVKNLCPHRLLYPNMSSRLETEECNNRQNQVCQSVFVFITILPSLSFLLPNSTVLTGIADHGGATTAIVGIHAESDYTRCLFVFFQAHRSLATRTAHNVKIRCCAWSGVACGAGGLDLD